MFCLIIVNIYFNCLNDTWINDFNQSFIALNYFTIIVATQKVWNICLNIAEIVAPTLSHYRWMVSNSLSQLNIYDRLHQAGESWSPWFLMLSVRRQEFRHVVIKIVLRIVLIILSTMISPSIVLVPIIQHIKYRRDVGKKRRKNIYNKLFLFISRFVHWTRDNISKEARRHQ